MVIALPQKVISSTPAEPAIPEELLSKLEAVSRITGFEETLTWTDLKLEVLDKEQGRLEISYVDHNNCDPEDLAKLLSTPIYFGEGTRIVCVPQDGTEVLEVLDLGDNFKIAAGTFNDDLRYKELPLVPSEDETPYPCAVIPHDGYYSFTNTYLSLGAESDNWSEGTFYVKMNVEQYLRYFRETNHSGIKTRHGVICIGCIGRYLPYWEDEDTGEQKSALAIIGMDPNGRPNIIFGQGGEVLFSYSGIIATSGGTFNMYEKVAVFFYGEQNDAYGYPYVSLQHIFDLQRSIARKAGYDPHYANGVNPNA